MSAPDTNTEAPFDVQYQNAIFTFFFLLVELYKTEMDSQSAVNKAADWLSSFAADIKSKSLEIAKENIDKSELFKQAQ